MQEQWLFVILMVMILISAFFSGSETSITALNPYRLHYLARKFRRAVYLVKLRERPDRLLGVILIGNTFANLAASSLATVIFLRWFGEKGVFLATLAMTFIVLIFAEITPKTMAVINPEKYALRSARVLYGLLRLIYPLVWVANTLSNALLKLLGAKIDRMQQQLLTRDEIKSIILSSTRTFSLSHQHMLEGVLDLDHTHVDDVMVPRRDMVAVDVQHPWQSIMESFQKAETAQVLICRNSTEQVIGYVLVQEILRLALSGSFNRSMLMRHIHPIKCIPEGTTLGKQLAQFKKDNQSLALVVDEYGDIQGMISMLDIIEEIMGEFAGSSSPLTEDITRQNDGSYLVAGNVLIRDLNRYLAWELPEEEDAKTLGGLLLERLEQLPDHPIGLRVSGMPMEIVSIEHHQIKQVRVMPFLRIYQHEVGTAL